MRNSVAQAHAVRILIVSVVVGVVGRLIANSHDQGLASFGVGVVIVACLIAAVPLIAWGVALGIAISTDDHATGRATPE